MDRFRRLTEFWSWLPAFRAVAETEHLPSAAEILGVGPSAISRSIRLLERRVGIELFDRVGRRIVLNASGRELLSAVRDSMRLLDDGVEQLVADRLSGEVRIASPGTVFSVFLMPALRELRERHPELVPVVEIGVPERVDEMLLRGAIDVAFQATPGADPQLSHRRLGSLAMGVYCAPSHPLSAHEGPVRAADFGPYHFVAPPDDARGRPSDGWPVSHPRTVALRVDQVRAGCDACADGPYLAVLPDALVAKREPRLHRLAFDAIPPLDLYAIHRSALGTHRRADLAVIDQVSLSIPPESS